MQNQNLNVEASYKTSAILWFAILVSQLMFLVVLFFAKPEVYQFDFSKPPLGENPALIIGLAVLGLSTFLMSFILKKKFITQAIDERNISLVQTALIVACALCEATSLFGLVSAFAASYQFFFAWFALGVFGTILHFPKRENLIAASYRK